MSTTFEKSNSSSLTNGSSSRLSETGHEDEPARFSRRIRLNEWTFSLSLLALSLSIVLGKLCVSYGSPLSSGNRYSIPSTFTQMYDRIPSVSGLPKLDVRRLTLLGSERFVNVGNEYAGAAANALLTFYQQYSWLLEATVCGLLVTSFTWFIIYKDSNVPGINPPYPFSPPRRRR
ncbi:hypothetical protein X777_08564 [Ooceraea biroi]|uniref:Uncharacterized protein n=1 Tax=Ooceraea biroi TaxID=2015173 RepID=A0A026W9S9_OOCBI|nr:hypothetical protein X777_08564 [Ooceraea biroi]